MSILNAILPWVQIVVSVILVATILIQQSDASLGRAFGGSGSGGINYQRRGPEKVLFVATIVLAAIFLLTALATLFL